MSYDIQIYSVRPFDPGIFDGAKNWNGVQSSFQTTKWQIVVNPSDKLLPEDVEDEIASLLPGIGFLTELNLEGVKTDEAMRRLRLAAKEIAKAAHGVIVDPQEDTVRTPAGVKRFSPAKEKMFSVLEFSWWFLGDALQTREKRETFFTLLERQLPEAMPRRYGTYEPPEHVYAETGKAHLHEFLDEKLTSPPVVWYPNRPVADLHLGFPPKVGPSRQGFRSNLVEIAVESAVLGQPGWDQTLRRFWRGMSKFLRPIYGEVRTKHGYSRSGGTLYHVFDQDKDEDQHLNSAWFWRGIPKKLGEAVVLGEQYQRLWPDFVAKSEMEDGLAFTSLADWSADGDLTEIVGATPDGLALHPGRGFGQKQAYAEIWPFGPVFS